MKHYRKDQFGRLIESHPLRVRGLKQTYDMGENAYKVASFTGAWIETDDYVAALKSEIVASFTGAWIETEKWYFV